MSTIWIARTLTQLIASRVLLMSDTGKLGYDQRLGIM